MSDEMSDILRCPFCGSVADIEEHLGSTTSKHYTANVQCSGCEAVIGKTGWGSSRLQAEVKAIQNWNTRADQPFPDTQPERALDPDMPAQELRHHMGELTANELRVARAAIRWANAAQAGQRQGEWRPNITEPKTMKGNTMTEDQIKYMVNRFLGWRLPKPWNPDNGINYQRPNYAHPPADHDWPTGTNLFDASQAEAMVRHMLDGIDTLTPNSTKAEH